MDRKKSGSLLVPFTSLLSRGGTPGTMGALPDLYTVLAAADDDDAAAAGPSVAAHATGRTPHRPWHPPMAEVAVSTTLNNAALRPPSLRCGGDCGGELLWVAVVVSPRTNNPPFSSPRLHNGGDC